MDKKLVLGLKQKVENNESLYEIAKKLLGGKLPIWTETGTIYCELK